MSCSDADVVTELIPSKLPPCREIISALQNYITSLLNGTTWSVQEKREIEALLKRARILLDDLIEKVLGNAEITNFKMKRERGAYHIS